MTNINLSADEESIHYILLQDIFVLEDYVKDKTIVKK